MLFQHRTIKTCLFSEESWLQYHIENKLWSKKTISLQNDRAYLKSSGVVHFFVESYDARHIVLSEVREVRFRGVQGITFRNEELETRIRSCCLFHDLRHATLSSSNSFYRFPTNIWFLQIQYKSRVDLSQFSPNCKKKFNSYSSL